VNIKLAVAQLECWKFENLKQSYPTQFSTPLLPFGEIATLNFITESSKLLVLDKSIFTDLEFLKKQFPSLNYNHLYTLLLKCTPDDFCPSEVPKNIILRLKEHLNHDQVMRDENYIYSVLSEYRI